MTISQRIRSIGSKIQGLFTKVGNRVIPDYSTERERKIRYPSSVRRINEKIRSYVDKFGYDSSMAQDLMSETIINIPDENLRYVNGVPQIAKPLDLAKKGVDLTDLEEIPTYGELKTLYADRYEKYAAQQDFFNEPADTINDFIDYMKTFDNLIVDKIKYVYGREEQTDNEREALTIMRMSHKTYDDLFKVNRLLS